MKFVYQEKYSHLFQPLTVGKGRKKILFKNRVFAAPMRTPVAVDAFGYLTAEGIEFYGGFAKGGFGAFSIPLKIPTDDTIGRSLVIDHEQHLSFSDVYKLQRYVHAYETVSIKSWLYLSLCRWHANYNWAERNGTEWKNDYGNDRSNDGGRL